MLAGARGEQRGRDGVQCGGVIGCGVARRLAAGQRDKAPFGVKLQPARLVFATVFGRRTPADDMQALAGL
jgi:hypothetical protein